MKAWKEKFMQGVFFIAACTSVLAVALICVFLFANGIPAMKEIGFMEFLTGERWKPTNEIFGILPMIMGSIYVTAGAIILGVPIGILTSVFMAKYCPKKIYPVLKGATELLAGIPSVVYGFFGLVVLVPLIRDICQKFHWGGNGSSILTASILLGMMILRRSSVSQSQRSVLCRRIIMRVHLHWGRHMSEVSFRLFSRQQNQVL